MFPNIHKAQNHREGLSSLTSVVLVHRDLPGVLPPPDHLGLRGPRGHALQGHVAALSLHHVRAAQAVHNLGRN